jgi:hypothetical protein
VALPEAYENHRSLAVAGCLLAVGAARDRRRRAAIRQPAVIGRWI